MKIQDLLKEIENDIKFRKYILIRNIICIVILIISLTFLFNCITFAKEVPLGVEKGLMLKVGLCWMIC